MTSGYEFYSPNRAGEITLKQCVIWRNALIEEAREVSKQEGKGLVWKVQEISRINNLDCKQLRCEFESLKEYEQWLER